MIQRKLLLGVLCLALAGPSLAASTSHGHAHAQAAPVTLQLDAGKKWPTDAALRREMAGLREMMAASLHDIHENRLPAKGYAALAGKVEAAVGRIVAECKLDPRADAQLHLIVGELLGGAERMAGKLKGAGRQGGAVRVIGALDQYASYFDDPAFVPIRH